MNWNRAAALVCVFALGGVTCLYGQEKIVETPYYPLKEGTRWEYQLKGQNVTIVMRVAKVEKLDNKMAALVETVVNNNVVASEHIRTEKDGVYRMTFMGQKAEPPVRILKLPAKKGDTWSVETKVMGQTAKGTFTLDEELVTVPYGKYKAYVAKSTDFEAAGQKISTTYWFAEGVGVVKQLANIAGTAVELDLVKFDTPQ